MSSTNKLPHGHNPQYQATVEDELPNSQGNIKDGLHESASVGDELPESRRSGMRLHNAHQSVIAHSLQNEQSINFNSQAVSSDGTGSQSIYADNVNIRGNVVNKTKHIYVSESTVVCDWLFSVSVLRFEEKQHENTQIASRKGAGTCQWLLDSTEFLSWRSGKIKRLWCPGIPGAGKTILTSIIINNLQRGGDFDNDNTACIYVYFDYKDQQRQDLTNILSSLLAQLLRIRTVVSPEVKNTYTALKIKGMYPSPEEHLRMLKSQVRSFSRVYIVVDALDECLNDAKASTMDEFLEALRKLPENVHFLFTSRPDISIGSKVKADRVIKIVASDDDLRLYIKNYVKNHDELKHMVEKSLKKDKSFLTRFLNAIITNSQGMFLLAQLHMDSLASTYTLEQLESGIVNLSRTPDEVYKATLDRISQQDEFKHTLAIKILAWLIFAERPLTITELQHALAVHVGDKALHESRLVSEKTLTSACAGIVSVDQCTKTVCLAHYTAEKYLKNNTSTLFKEAQSSIAETCLVYLCFEEFGVVPESANVVFERQKKHPFLRYAADHWGDHVASGVKSNVYQLASLFLSNGPKVNNAFQVMSDQRFRNEGDITGLHVAAFFGLDKLAKRLLRQGFEMNARTERGETAMHWAGFYGQTRVLKELIDQKAELNIRDKDGRTVLHRAIINGDIPSVELLLSANTRIDLNYQDSLGWTPLRWASAYGQYVIADLLLKSGAEVNAEDKDGYTALWWAAQRGHRRIVEMLLNSDASVDMSSKDKWSLLLWAAREGQDFFIRLLIEKKTDLNTTDSNGYTALRWAVDYQHGMTAWLLIQAQADVNKRDAKWWTPLHSAIDKWRMSSDKSLVWLLLHNGANINARNKLGLTALHIAATRGDSSVVWLLLEKGADKKIRDENGRTALHCAIVEGHGKVTWILIQTARELLNARDGEHRSPLHVAASAGNLSIVLQLLRSRAELDIPDSDGNTPLNCAIFHHHQPVVACLIKHGADVNVPNKKGCVALHCAAQEGNITIINTLLQSAEADTTIENNKGQTPWELSEYYGHGLEKF